MAMVEVTLEDLYCMLKDVKLQNIGIKEELESLRVDLSHDLSNLNEKVAALEQENQTLKARLLQTERKIKKYNLVIYGIEDNANESPLLIIKDVLAKHLNIVLDDIEIRDSFRIPSNQPKKPKPILVEVLNFSRKKDILAKAALFKSTGIYVTNDYTSEDYNKKKQMQEYRKDFKKQNFVAKVVGTDKLVIDKNIFP